MSKREKRLTKGQGVTIAIVAVSILLLISIWLLLFVGGNSSSYSPGNLIEGVDGEIITLADKESEQSRFNVENMLPGDSQTKNYYIQINTAKVKATSFRADITSDSAELENVLLICVRADQAEEALYDGLVKDMPQRLRAEASESATRTVYEITVSLDVRAGNECQNKQIALDFSWWVDENDFITEGTGGGDVTGAGGKCCPWCFSVCPWCWIIPLIILILVILAVGAIIVWRLGKRSDGAQKTAAPTKNASNQKNKNGKKGR